MCDACRVGSTIALFVLHRHDGWVATACVHAGVPDRRAGHSPCAGWCAAGGSEERTQGHSIPRCGTAWQLQLTSTEPPLCWFPMPCVQQPQPQPARQLPEHACPEPEGWHWHGDSFQQFRGTGRCGVSTTAARWIHLLRSYMFCIFDRRRISRRRLPNPQHPVYYFVLFLHHSSRAQLQGPVLR